MYPTMDIWRQAASQRPYTGLQKEKGILQGWHRYILLPHADQSFKSAHLSDMPSNRIPQNNTCLLQTVTLA